DQYPEQLLPLSLDVTHQAQVQETVASAMKKFGGIDVLVNNAGYGLVGAVKEVDDTEVRRQFETNVFGTLNVTRAVLPVMRTQHRGHILNISSVGGFAAATGFGIYNASKFAIEGFSEAMAQEVAPLGIPVTIVEPGYFRTNFAGRSLVRAKHQIASYSQTSGVTRERMTEVNGKQPGDPARGVQAMIKVVNLATPPLRLVLGADALERIRVKLASVASELDAWEETSVNTAFETGQAQ
ncbi:MAG: SDR family NAD(P)-dependent oxidoreductase, partial [Chloroflexi bacterium]|nr:SDR family NAD(P)-dependent oxidoreductase [Chloroflexota bacterium]